MVSWSNGPANYFLRDSSLIPLDIILASIYGVSLFSCSHKFELGDVFELVYDVLRGAWVLDSQPELIGGRIDIDHIDKMPIIDLCDDCIVLAEIMQDFRSHS